MILWNMAMGSGMGPIACFRNMGGFPIAPQTPIGIARFRELEGFP